MGDKAYSSYANMDFAGEQRHHAADHVPATTRLRIATARRGTSSSTCTRSTAGTFLKAYHKRSNVESTFSAIKRVFGDFVRSRNKTAQINEVLLKIICHNLRQIIFAMFELGLAPTFGQKSSLPEKSPNEPTCRAKPSKVGSEAKRSRWLARASCADRTSNSATSASNDCKARRVVFVLVDGKLNGAIALADILRPEAKQANW